MSVEVTVTSLSHLFPVLPAASSLPSLGSQEDADRGALTRWEQSGTCAHRQEAPEPAFSKVLFCAPVRPGACHLQELVA